MAAKSATQAVVRFSLHKRCSAFAIITRGRETSRDRGTFPRDVERQRDRGTQGQRDRGTFPRDIEGQRDIERHRGITKVSFTSRDRGRGREICRGREREREREENFLERRREREREVIRCGRERQRERSSAFAYCVYNMQ